MAQETNARQSQVAEARGLHLESAPKLYRSGLARAFAGKSSPRAAIKAKCLDCCHWDRAEVVACTVVLCPLHAYRPYQTSG